MGNVSLQVLEKSLNFCVQKRVGTLNSKIYGKEPQCNETLLIL